MSVNCDLVLTEALAYHINQFVEIVDEPFDCHGGLGNFGVERFAGAALVPVDNRKAFLKWGIEVTEKTHLGKTGPTVHQD